MIGHDHVAGIEHLGVDLERRGFAIHRFTVVPEDRFTRPDVSVTFPDPLGWDLVVTLGAPWPRRAVDGWAREVAFLARRHDEQLTAPVDAEVLATGGTPGPSRPSASTALSRCSSTPR